MSQGRAHAPPLEDPLAFFTVPFAVKYAPIRRVSGMRLARSLTRWFFSGRTCVCLKPVNLVIFIGADETKDTGRNTTRVRSARPVKRAPVHVTFSNFLIIFD